MNSKIAYIGKIQLSDVDLSYLHEAQQQADITYLMEVTPRFMQGPAFNISKIYPHTGIYRATDAYPEFRKYEGFIDLDKFYVVNTCGRLWALKAIWTNLLMLIFLIRHRYTTIHWTWSPNIYEFWTYFLYRRMVLTVHDPFPHSGQDTHIVRLRRKVAFGLIPKLIILNQSQRQQFLEYYHLPSERVISSQLSCYTYLQTIEGDDTGLPQKPYILFVGKISPYKGLDFLLPAMEQVHKVYPNYTLVVAGNGRYHFDITPFLQSDYIDIRNRFIPQEELVALMRHCTFVVCPYTDATQSGVIMSAFAFSKPVLATQVGALPEMVKEDRFGRLIPEKDVDALADGMLQMLSNPRKLDIYSQNIAMAYSDGENAWKNISTRLLSVL